MCLGIVTKRRFKKNASVVCWKIFRKQPIQFDINGKGPTKDQYTFEVLDHRSNAFLLFPGTVMRDRFRRNIEMNDGSYPCGYHAYASAIAAKNHVMFNPNKVVFKVRLSNLKAKGRQNGHIVYVGRKLEIIERLARRMS
jgi:hypothetical protein